MNFLVDFLVHDCKYFTHNEIFFKSRSVLIPLGLTVAVSATDAGIYKIILG